uniref:Uncharacterized protein n=1 Tax=Clastoptera arizonana TaxID=38151 RepID=A0A1B6D411_9HEMI
MAELKVIHGSTIKEEVDPDFENKSKIEKDNIDSGNISMGDLKTEIDGKNGEDFTNVGIKSVETINEPKNENSLLFEILSKMSSDLSRMSTGFNKLNNKIDKINEELNNNILKLNNKVEGFKTEFENKILGNYEITVNKIEIIRDEVLSVDRNLNTKIDIVENNVKELDNKIELVAEDLKVNIDNKLMDLKKEISVIKDEASQADRSLSICGDFLGEIEVPNFLNEKIGPHPKAFLEALEMNIGNNRGNWKYNALYIRKYFKEDAGVWFEAHRSNWESFSEFKKNFLERFWSQQKQEDLRERILTRRPFRGNTNDCNNYVVRMYQQAQYLDPPMKIEVFVRSIVKQLPESIALILLASEPKTLEEVENKIMEWQERQKYCERVNNENKPQNSTHEKRWVHGNIKESYQPRYERRYNENVQVRTDRNQKFYQNRNYYPPQDRKHTPLETTPQRKEDAEINKKGNDRRQQ